MDGQVLPTAEAVVSVSDRSFLYGDGLFESLPWDSSRLFRWREHWDRLTCGARFLGIRINWDESQVRNGIRAITASLESPQATVRLHLSRGVGPRGYSPRGADAPRLIVTVHPAPAMPLGGWPALALKTCRTFAVATGDPLATYKSANKLLNVLARAEAEAQGFDEALLVNTDGRVTESSSGNVFWWEEDSLHTPPLSAGVLPGVTRGAVLNCARELGWTVTETAALPSRLSSSGGIFLTFSTRGLVPVRSLDSQVVPIEARQSRLQDAFLQCCEREWEPV
jgi:branched-subunit amino acid aminotransferase/4-amino-4-deoxychorismate lyase